MESRNVKVIDEHSIDRDAYVVCGINVDNIDYVLYSIERDGENDNLFVSKIIKNIDGTSNMINIEDNMEKNKINEVVKELITYSIKNEADKTTGSVTLNDGKVVTISTVLFNKEQNINVGKTYITTVKKSVTKVSEDFYKVPEVKKEENHVDNVFEVTNKDVFAMPAESLNSSVNENNLESDVVKISESSQEVEDSLLKVESEGVQPILDEKPVFLEPEPVPVVELPVLPAASPVVLGEEKQDETQSVIVPTGSPSSVVVPVQSILPAGEEKTEEHTDMVNEPIKVEEPVIPSPIPVSPIPTVIPTVTPLITEEPKVEPILSNVSEPKLADNISMEEPKLFFDGSNETNLNQALGEVSDDKTLTTQEDGVESLREFGVDAPVNETSISEVPAVENPKVLKRSKGFANNKFFMIIAIVFFIGACVFLGYEAFNYFQLVK